MITKKTILFVFCLIGLFSDLRVYSQSFPSNIYRTAENRMYWKNRPPYAGYWQQDVHYTIKAELNDKTGVVTGSEELEYWNNSPDTLKYVYFHMYSNAFTPGSYSDALYKANHIKPYYGRAHEARGEGIQVSRILSGNEKLTMELDNTILKVYLKSPLAPNTHMTFNLDFKSYFDEGTVRRRMKIFSHNNNKHFDGVHWYPRISVYDRKQGWDTDQHLGREFYGDYGTYDVALTFPSNYVMDATGVLINRDQVLPSDLRQKLDIKNFVSKPLNAPPSVIIPEDNTTKTWIFHAINVHDFAWTADPTYRIGEASWNGIQCIALAQEEHAARWQTAAAFTAKLIEVYSRDFGMYEWPKIIVADAQDGMEYPMLTLCGGLDPDYHYVIAHEVGHEWFFGMLGNNETYRAMMDEGFTQFLTAWSEIRIDGPYGVRANPTAKNIKKRDLPATIDGVVYNSYMRDAGNEDNITINTHSDYFGSAIGHGGGYGQVYYKTATMLYNLQYVLGDSLFKKAMQNYVSKWKICHPYVEDFEDAIIGYTHFNLKWFFDAWITTNKVIDYRIKSVKKGDSTGKWSIVFERKGGLQMPLDFTVYSKEGKTYNYYIPCNRDSKQTNATILKPWIGWDKLNETYKADIKIEGSIDNVVLDTSYRMADVNELDNQLKFPLVLKFDRLGNSFPDRYHYNMLWRPDLWYNAIDGFKIGVHFEGNFMGNRDRLWFTAWYNTGLLTQNRPNISDKTNRLPVSVIFTYGNALKCLDKDLDWTVEARVLDGLWLGKLGISKSLREDFDFYLNYKAMIRPKASDLDYVLFPGQGESGKWNNTINMELRKTYTGGFTSLKLRTTGPGSNFSYSTLSLEAKESVYLGKMLVKARGIAVYQEGDVPKESQLYLATANPEELMDNKYTRSAGFFPEAWLGYGALTNHFTAGGGLGLRGYSGYLAPVSSGSNQELTYASNAGAAINMELDFSRFFNFRPGALGRSLMINPYLFGDAGIINGSGNSYQLHINNPRLDGGAGFLFTIKSWANLPKPQPLAIRVDFPFYLSDRPFAETGNNLAFRWMVGVNRAF